MLAGSFFSFSSESVPMIWFGGINEKCHSIDMNEKLKIPVIQTEVPDNTHR